jgi:hypothetical protein
MEIAAGDRAGAGEFHLARPWVDSANFPVAPGSFFPVLAVRIDESPQRVDNRSGGKQGLDPCDWAVAPEWVDSPPRGWSAGRRYGDRPGDLLDPADRRVNSTTFPQTEEPA